MQRAHVNKAVLHFVQPRSSTAAELQRLSRDKIKGWPWIPGRSRHRLQDLDDRSLMLNPLAIIAIALSELLGAITQLRQQPSAFHSDYGLGREILQQTDFVS